MAQVYELSHFDFWRKIASMFISNLMHLSMSSPSGGGRGVGATHGNLTVLHIPRVGILTWHHAFDLSILKSRWEVNHLFLLILTIILCPGVGILIIFFRKCQNPHPMPDPLPPSGLTLIGALQVVIISELNIPFSKKSCFTCEHLHYGYSLCRSSTSFTNILSNSK